MASPQSSTQPPPNPPPASLPPRRFVITVLEPNQPPGGTTYSVYGCQWVDQVVVLEWLLPTATVSTYPDLPALESSPEYASVTSFAFIDDYWYDFGQDQYGNWQYGG